jgi:hypothetical protein
LALVTSASPAHVALFAPPARASQYTFLTTSEPIEAVIDHYRRAHPSPDRRSWTLQRSGILDVFDTAALYDRSRLARLYRGQAVRVARGPIIENGSVTHAVLLLSPYPEPDLKRLNPGTLVMVVAATVQSR